MSLIDCDIHCCPATLEETAEYFAEPYRSEFIKFGERKLGAGIRFEDGGNRWDCVDEDGRSGAHNPDVMQKQLLDKYGHRVALISGTNHLYAGRPDPDYGMAVCRGLNDYIADKWLTADERFYYAANVDISDPVQAAREVERWAGNPRIPCIGISGTAGRIPLGHRYFWPFFEACNRHNLPIHIHPSTTAVIACPASMPTGMATNYLQSHTILPTFYMSDLVSLIFEGTFERFPNLKFLFIEGGVTWLVHLLWRMDKEYRALRQQAPMLKRLPSEYVRDHIRFGTQPIEEPKKAEHLKQAFDIIGADNIVVYASDYPHFDFDEPGFLPKALGETTLRRILHDNAAEFLGLDLHPVETRSQVAVAA